MKFKHWDLWLFSTRLLGILLIAISIVQFIYFTNNSNNDYRIFAIIFLSAIFLTIISTIISVANSWFYSNPKLYQVEPGYEPHVGVIIPTCGEPIKMVLNTLTSVLQQDWPKEKLIAVVS